MLFSISRGNRLGGDPYLLFLSLDNSIYFVLWDTWTWAERCFATTCYIPIRLGTWRVPTALIRLPPGNIAQRGIYSSDITTAICITMTVLQLVTMYDSLSVDKVRQI